MGDTCCLCVPLNAGAKILGIFTILFTIALGVFSYFDDAFFHLMWPIILCYIIMSIIWLGALLSQGYRTIVSHCWVILMVLSAGIYYLVILINGSALEYLCSEENLQQINQDMADIAAETGADLGDPVTEEQCKWGGKTGLIIDCAGMWIFNIYYAYVIIQWKQ